MSNTKKDKKSELELEEKKKTEEKTYDQAIEEDSLKVDASKNKKEGNRASENSRGSEGRQASATIDKQESKDKKIFGKKNEKKDKKDAQIEKITDRLTRQMAEFDNYRKRTDQEKASMYMIGAKDVIEKLLPVLDNFERGLAGVDLTDPFVDGMNKIYKQLNTMMDNLGVTVIESVGKEFDTHLHNAVMHVEDEKVGENIIVEEFQKGYKYKDVVVRHSMVKVAN